MALLDSALLPHLPNPPTTLDQTKSIAMQHLHDVAKGLDKHFQSLVGGVQLAISTCDSIGNALVMSRNEADIWLTIGTLGMSGIVACMLVVITPLSCA